MKPLQIGLLVVAGALGGALIMRFTQRPAPAPVPAARMVPAPVPAAAPAPAAETVPAAPTPAPQVHHAKPAHVSRPARPAKPAVTTVAQNRPPEPAPAPPQPQSAVSEPVPMVQEPPTPPPAAVPAPATVPESAEAPPAPAPAPVVTLQAGMLLPVRLGENLSSERNQPGDTFTATLDAPLAADGFVIAERGARLEGKVVEVQKASHVKGQALLGLELTKLDTSDGQHVSIQTETFRRLAPRSSTTDNVGIVAAAAGIGAVIGAIAGGGKGAGIGAAAGGAAGAGGVMATRAKAVSLPSETRISFRLREALTLTEQVNR
jgi:hypothetical protein